MKKSEASQEVEQKKPVCFIICPIGDAGSPTRKRSNQVQRFIIEPAAREHGFEVVRADKIGEAGIITSQIVQFLIDSELVIADLTDNNANVFYELAIRHMIRKPFIQIRYVSQGQPPFDVAGMRTMPFNHLDLDDAKEAAETLADMIGKVRKQVDIVTPISAAIDVMSLVKSDKPEERQIAELVKTVSTLQSSINFIGQVVGRIPIPFAPYLPSSQFFPSGLGPVSINASMVTLPEGPISETLWQQLNKHPPMTVPPRYREFKPKRTTDPPGRKDDPPKTDGDDDQ